MPPATQRSLRECGDTVSFPFSSLGFRVFLSPFGGDAGGHLIPDRTFFFGAAEWNRRREAPDARNASSANIPTPAGYAALAKTMDPRALRALRLASREDIRYLGPLTFHDKRFYQDVDLAFKERVTAGDSYTVSQLLDSMTRGDDVLDNRLHAINRPTLVIWGRDDKLIPLNFGERFHQGIAGSRLRIIDNCGHMPQVECANEFTAAVLEFLSEAK